jgi:hypothetical protein
MKAFSSRERLEQALTRINDPKGEGAKACLTVYTEAARAAADAADARAKAGVSLGPLDGVIVSIKDLFDVAGEPTRAGSKVLADEAQPAATDAPVVRRLRAGGAVIVAKTNMTELPIASSTRTIFSAAGSMRSTDIDDDRRAPAPTVSDRGSASRCQRGAERSILPDDHLRFGCKTSQRVCDGTAKRFLRRVRRLPDDDSRHLTPTIPD